MEKVSARRLQILIKISCLKQLATVFTHMLTKKLDNETIE